MTKYYYIPVTEEIQFSQLINQWLLIQPDTSFIATKGVYIETQILNIDNSPIINKNINGITQYVKKGFEDKIENIKFKLIGYTLEADLSNYNAIYEQAIYDNPNILTFYSSDDLLNWGSNNNYLI